ncbi:linear amide C-N hydrolase [Lentilactobacillus kribbianus]|uniref:linear amide C-N hydrolase n=1 Tax=Lentilactobacillus kribbianus TaxID=2729622 RepID=UPI0015519B56|nr:linear amide C-N hydrolase [Lentilactobacillus kribbianus]
MCTSIFQISIDENHPAHVLGRTMDWPRLGAAPVFCPRDFEWQSVYDNQSYRTKYALVGGGGYHDNELDVSDGVNEHGLTVQKLTFTNGTQLVDEPTPGKIHLAPYELSFYLLANFQSVQDIVEHITEIELMTDHFSRQKYGKVELHFVAADATGRVVVIEPDQQPIRIIENPLGILTNSNHFERQIDKLRQYVDFTPAFNAGNVPLNTPRVTTGNVSGKAIPPGSYTPNSRFIRAAYYKERIDLATDLDSAVDNVWHLLDSVNVPKNTSHQQTYSVYRAAADCDSLTYYYQPYHAKQVAKITLTKELIAEKQLRFFPVINQVSFQELN